MERQKAEEEAKAKKLAEIAELQRQRELEIEVRACMHAVWGF